MDPPASRVVPNSVTQQGVQCGLVVDMVTAGSTHAGDPRLIPSAGRKNERTLALATRQDRLSNWSINRHSL